MQTIHSRLFSSCQDAGLQLAKRLAKFANVEHLIVLALPRGGVPVAAEIAKTLRQPLDVMLVRRIILPGSDDISLGAITSGGIRSLNHEMIDRMHLSKEEVSDMIFKESLELVRRQRLYRGDHRSLEIADHHVILVDDGFTPSSLIRDAIRLLRRQHPDRITLALPAAPSHVTHDLGMETDEVVTVAETEPFATLGACFKDLAPTTDAEVLGLLGRTGESRPAETGDLKSKSQPKRREAVAC